MSLSHQMLSAPVDLELKFTQASLSLVAENGSFTGYASLFDKVDLGQDAVARGAFVRSLERRGIRGVKMLFQHDPNDVIGTWTTIREDGQGLYVEGQLAANVTRAEEVRALMQAGALDGLSIGFKTVRSRRDGKSGVRTLTEVDLWEISVVTFPMLPDARIGASHDLRASMPAKKMMPDIRAFERWLTRDAGFSRADAHTVIHQGYKALFAQKMMGQTGDRTGLRDAPVEDAAAALMTRLAAAKQLMQTTR